MMPESRDLDSRGLDFKLEINQFDELRCPEKDLVKVSPKVFQGGLALSVFFTSEEFGFQLSAKTDFSLNFLCSPSLMLNVQNF